MSETRIAGQVQGDQVGHPGDAQRRELPASHDDTEPHELKKLLTLYWEITPKYDDQRKLVPEMILVCNALLTGLNHANEYVRGSMLRFLCKLREPELLDPLIPTIKECLEHRHSYVRKNAALAVFCAH